MVERVVKVERVEKVEKVERVEKVEKVEKVERVERVESEDVMNGKEYLRPEISAALRMASFVAAVCVVMIHANSDGKWNFICRENYMWMMGKTILFGFAS